MKKPTPARPEWQKPLEEGLHVVATPIGNARDISLRALDVPTNQFLFVGFLPASRAARRAALDELGNLRTTLIFFEAPQRLKETLEDMIFMLGEREAAVARELTKLHENVRRGNLQDLATFYE